MISNRVKYKTELLARIMRFVNVYCVSVCVRVFVPAGRRTHIRTRVPGLKVRHTRNKRIFSVQHRFTKINMEGLSYEVS